jgi:AraC-like DNA-binding protein
MEQRLEIGRLRRHRHPVAYAAIVLSGSYDEFGDAGRWRLSAGDIVAHRVFEAHGNTITRQGTVVLNLPLPMGLSLPPVFSVADPDAVIRAVRAGNADLPSVLRSIVVRAPAHSDWPDELAAALRHSPVRLGDWAQQRGLAPATVSRGFRAAFGTTAARYRAEIQTQRALRRILFGREPLADIASACGFADQAHMSRAVLALTGQTPLRCRKIKSIQDPAR